MTPSDIKNIAEIYEIQNGFAFKSSEFTSSGVPIIRISDIQDENVRLEDAVYFKKSSEFDRYEVSKGDILIALSGATTGKFGIYQNDQKAYLNQRVARFRPIKTDPFANQWLFYFFHYKRQEILKEAWGGAQPNISTKKIEQMEIPYPSDLKEIIQKVDSVFEKIDFSVTHLNQAKNLLAQFKQSILNSAIRGKLVPQDPKDEPASELLKRIQKEKEKLIAEKKIKKEKPLPPITEDEIPFELPEGWEWARMNDILEKLTDGTHHSPANGSNGEFKYVTAKNIRDSGLDLGNITYVTREIHHEIYARCSPRLGDVLLIKDGATTGIACLNTLDEPFSMLSSVALLRPFHSFVLNEYLLTYLKSPTFQNLTSQGMTGSAIKRLTLSKIATMLIPIPPLGEQYKIVRNIKETLIQIENLSNLVEENLSRSTQLKQSILKKAFEGELI